MREAARNEGGGAGMGMGLGAGISFGQNLAQAFQNKEQVPQQTGDDTELKLEKLKKMVEAQLITDEEYAEKKKQLLDNF